VTTLVTWTSSDGTVATISNAAGSRGLATTLKAGSVTIKATLGPVSGTATLCVGSQTLTSITVTPTGGSVAKGASLAFTATGHYSDSSTYDLTAFATWISTAPTVAAVSNADGSQGLATGLATGTTSIEAHFQGKTGSTGLTVTP
jgi:uncharacterized protein YjdB